MKKAKKMICILLAAALLGLTVTGCGEKSESEDAFVLNVCVCDSITSLDPAMNTDSAAQSVFYALYENLMRCTNDGSGNAVVSPGIAKEYTESVNYDGTVTYRFTIRSSARWSDGEAVRAQDFVYAWQRLVDPATASPNHAVLEMVQGYDTVRETGDVSKLGVLAKNDSTFVVTLAKPCSFFIEGVCTSVATMPLREDMVSAAPDSWAGSRNILTDGAYQVTRWSPENSLDTQRNTEYYESKLVGPDSISFRFAADTASAYALYESGEVDYVSRVPEEVVAQLASEPNFRSIDLGSTFCVLFNNYTDAFSEEEVRAAFDLAIDRTAVAQSAGAAMTAAGGLVPFGIQGGEKEEDFRTAGGELCPVDEEGYAERCASAVSSLNSAGYYRGAAFPHLTMIYDGSDEACMAAALALQQMWKDVLGVTIVPTAVSPEELNERLRNGNYDLAAAYLSADYNDAMSFLEGFSSDSQKNLVHYNNETYDILMGVVDSAENDTARTAFLHDAEALLLEDSAVAPVYFAGTAALLRESLYGIYFDSVGRCYLTNVSKSE